MGDEINSKGISLPLLLAVYWQEELWKSKGMLRFFSAVPSLAVCLL